MKSKTTLSRLNLEKVIKNRLLNKVFRQIKEISKPGEGKELYGFILGTLLIDYLAGFYTGVTKKTLYKDSGERFRAFSKKYISKFDNRYNSNHLWSAIRSRLVHNYAVDLDYGFTHSEQDGKHFEKKMHKNGKEYIVLNLQDFLNDIQQAGQQYLHDLKKYKNYYNKAFKRYKSIGLIGYIEPKR